MKDIIPNSSAVVGPVGSEGGRSPSTLSIGQAVPSGGLAPGQRWSVGRKRKVVPRTRAIGNRRALREREGDPLNEELAAAMKRIGELTMETEVLRARVGHVGPLARRRSR
jgi:transposase